MQDVSAMVQRPWSLGDQIVKWLGLSRHFGVPEALQVMDSLEGKVPEDHLPSVMLAARATATVAGLQDVVTDERVQIEDHVTGQIASARAAESAFIERCDCDIAYYEQQLEKTAEDKARKTAETARAVSESQQLLDRCQRAANLVLGKA